MEDIDRVCNIIPDESLVSFCGNDYNDWRLNATLERFHHIKLTLNTHNTNFILIENDCSKQKLDEINNLGFLKMPLQTSTIHLYSRNTE